MMKKILSILLAGLLLLSLIACGAEDITPPKNDEPDLPAEDQTSEDNENPEDSEQPKDDETPEDNGIPFESGILPTLVSAFYDDLTYFNFKQKKDEIPDPIVNFVDTVAEFERLVDMETMESLQELLPEHRTPMAQEACELTEKVQSTEDFFETKQLITVTHLQTGVSGDYLVAEKLIKEEDGSYRLLVSNGCKITSADDGLFIDMVGVIVEKSLGITPENLTVELVDRH